MKKGRTMEFEGGTVWHHHYKLTNEGNEVDRVKNFDGSKNRSI